MSDSFTINDNALILSLWLRNSMRICMCRVCCIHVHMWCHVYVYVCMVPSHHRRNTDTLGALYVYERLHRHDGQAVSSSSIHLHTYIHTYMHTRVYVIECKHSRHFHIVCRKFIETALYQDAVLQDRMFLIFDSNKQGTITFKDYVMGLSKLSNKTSIEIKLKGNNFDSINPSIHPSIHPSIKNNTLHLVGVAM